MSTLNIKLDHDLSLLSPRPLYVSFYFNFSPGTRSIFSPFCLVIFYPPPLPCSCSTFPFSAFFAYFRNFFFPPRLAALRFIQPFALVAPFPAHCILPLRFAPFVRFCFKILKFCYFSLVFVLFFNCFGYYFFLFFCV